MVTQLPQIASSKCRNPACRIALGEPCVDGRDPVESCPHYQLDADIDELDDDSTDDEESDQEDDTELDESPRNATPKVDLPSGDPLNLAGVVQFLRWRPAKFITIVGERGSGKTTLISALYEQFLDGPFADCYFAGSRTLMAFEKRSHYARAASGQPLPDTIRTSRQQGLEFFHLAVSEPASQFRRHDLMLSDRAGEDYQRAREYTPSISELIEVEKADVIVLLLDGDRLIDPEQQSVVLEHGRQLLRALLGARAIGSYTTVQVVTTKVDVIADYSEKDSLTRRMDAFKDRLQRLIGDQVGKLAFYDIAARSPNASFTPALGVDKLLHSWIDLSRHPISTPSSVIGRLHEEFDLLLTRPLVENA